MIAPLLGVLLFYVAKFDHLTFAEYLSYIKMPFIFSPMMSLGVVLNLFVFFIFIQRNFYRAARAVIFACILYSIPILIVKFFM